jgi:hypothetical protein
MKQGGAQLMAQACYMAEVMMTEELQGGNVAVRKCSIVVDPESSSRTIEGLDNYIRALFGVGTGVHLRITGDQWDTRKREARFTAGDLAKKRKFLVRFGGNGKMPDWSETDW